MRRRSETIRNRRRNPRGIQMVELAICLPILLTLFAITGEMGRLYFTTATLAKGTRLAARYLSTSPLNTNDNVTLHYGNAKNLAVYGKTAPTIGDPPIIAGLTVNNIVISTSGGTAARPEFITVRVTGVSFSPLINLNGLLRDPAFTLAVPLSPGTTMRYLITQPLN